MNKQEQIEEMEKIIDELYNVYDTTAGDIAEGLYNAGYRKVPFDIRRCFNEIEMKMKFKTDFGTIDFTEEQILFIEQAICWEEEKIRKETAKEIERLKAENEELTKVVSSKVYDLIDNAKEIADARETWEKQAKIEAVKEFAEKVKAKSYVNDYCREVVEIEKIDELLKEYENESIDCV